MPDRLNLLAIYSPPSTQMPLRFINETVGLKQWFIADYGSGLFWPDVVCKLGQNQDIVDNWKKRCPQATPCRKETNHVRILPNRLWQLGFRMHYRDEQRRGTSISPSLHHRRQHHLQHHLHLQPAEKFFSSVTCLDRSLPLLQVQFPQYLVVWKTCNILFANWNRILSLKNLASFLC